MPIKKNPPQGKINIKDVQEYTHGEEKHLYGHRARPSGRGFMDVLIMNALIRKGI